MVDIELILILNDFKDIVKEDEFLKSSGGELLELRLLDTRLLDTFGRKSIARHEIDKLLESS